MKKFLSTLILIIFLYSTITLGIDFEHIKKVNLFLFNRNQGGKGSATVIQYKEKIYVLACKHQVASMADDILAFGEFGYKKLIPIMVHPKYDMVILTFAEEITDIPYATLSEQELKKGQHVYVIGNPGCREDVISDGIIMDKDEQGWLTSAKIFFGNSGGGVYNVDGELIGILYGLETYSHEYISYSNGLFTDVKDIKKLLDAYNSFINQIKIKIKEVLPNNSQEQSLNNYGK